MSWQQIVGTLVLTAIAVIFFFRYMWSEPEIAGLEEETNRIEETEEDLRKPDLALLSDIESATDPEELIEIAEIVLWNMDSFVPVEADAFLNKLRHFSDNLEMDDWYTILDVSPEDSELEKFVEAHLQPTC